MRRLARARVVVMVALAACGGEPEAPPHEPAAEPSSGGESLPGASGGMAVTGIMGTIPTRRIEETMQAKLPAFQRCFVTGTADNELIGGHIKLYFRVGLSGEVEWVHPRGSSIGHRATERCLLDIAKRARFPKPQGGGAAEFVWGFEIDNPAGVRPPVEWDASRVQSAVATQREALAACELGGARYVVTLYVSTAGEVLSVGVAADSQEAADKIDCLVDAIKAWRMPEPGSYPAKVTFGL